MGLLLLYFEEYVFLSGNYEFLEHSDNGDYGYKLILNLPKRAWEKIRKTFLNIGRMSLFFRSFI